MYTLTGYLKIILRQSLKIIVEVKKTIFKMAKPPENGVWMVVFLTEVDFRPRCRRTRNVQKRRTRKVKEIFKKINTAAKFKWLTRNVNTHWIPYVLNNDIMIGFKVLVNFIQLKKIMEYNTTILPRPKTFEFGKRKINLYCN